MSRPKVNDSFSKIEGLQIRRRLKEQKVFHATKIFFSALSTGTMTRTAILYFAYGSNLYWPQMKRRCPGAVFVDLAVLPEHRLAFTRYSGGFQGGVADVVPDPASQVWGVVYRLYRRDLESLDSYEGYRGAKGKNAYLRVKTVVWQQGDPARPLEVYIYRAVPQADFIKPSREYLKLIEEGARSWGLPAEYIDQILKASCGPEGGQD